MLHKTKWLYLILFVGAMLALPSAAPAQISVGVSIHIGPPPLPVYVQPVCPSPGYLWTPGYWAYGPDGYYWVPGTWVEPPRVGVLWTPGYWGWGGGAYIWHAGYWGPHVGFYGGINYGFGYGGVGFGGGAWRGGVFAYNTAVVNVNTTVIHNTYIDRTVIRTTTINRVSYNGGSGGIGARPTEQERAFEHEQHIPANSMQMRHEEAARHDHTLLASVNHGRPAVAATARPGAFHGEGAVGARAPSPNPGRSIPRPGGDSRSGNPPRPPANNLANNHSNYARPDNARPNNARPNNDPPNMSRVNAGRGNEPHLSQSSHASQSHDHPSGGHAEAPRDHKER